MSLAGDRDRDRVSVSVSVRQLAPRVLVYPAHTTPPPAAAGTLCLPLLPSAAFGDGSHPTTRLCAAAIDQLLRERPAAALLDVGTGNGILARIAAARGVPRVVGTDTDPLALAAARANLALDAPGGRAALRGSAGSAVAGQRGARHARDQAAASACPDRRAAITLSDRSPDSWGPAFDLVVANILAPVLGALAPALCAALAPGGRLLLAGLTAEQAPGLRVSYAAWGLALAEAARSGPWVLLAGARAAGPRGGAAD